MPFITGKITHNGAIVVVRVGVSHDRQACLESVRFAVPERISVRAQIDTGSFVTVFSPRAFEPLGISPVEVIAVRTPSTKPGEPCLCDVYDVSVTRMSGTSEVIIPNLSVITSLDLDQDGEEVQAILGRDILNHCAFNYYGPHREFHLAF